MTRGPERSRKLEDVVGEVTDLGRAGTTEVTLLGQTVNSYDDGTHDFADLLRAVGRIPGLRRLRVPSPHPTGLTQRPLPALGRTPPGWQHRPPPGQGGPAP